VAGAEPLPAVDAEDVGAGVEVVLGGIIACPLAVVGVSVGAVVVSLVAAGAGVSVVGVCVDVP
jgi:hypothetical protein